MTRSRRMRVVRMRLGNEKLSPGIVTLPDPRLGFDRGVLVRDPDGHVMEVVKR